MSDNFWAGVIVSVLVALGVYGLNTIVYSTNPPKEVRTEQNSFYYPPKPKYQEGSEVVYRTYDDNKFDIEAVDEVMWSEVHKEWTYELHSGKGVIKESDILYDYFD